MRYKILLVLTLFFVMTSCNTTNIYLVRHGEKQNAEANSPLSEAGQQRAIALRDMMIGKDINAIYATNYIRTQNTAKPLADALQKTIITYSANEKFIEELKNLKNKNVLVVGHSNTIPEIIEKMTGERVSISEDQFNQFYTIRIDGDKIKFSKTTYGK